jgi:hypothetical protein
MGGLGGDEEKKMADDGTTESWIRFLPLDSIFDFLGQFIWKF